MYWGKIFIALFNLVVSTHSQSANHTDAFNHGHTVKKTRWSSIQASEWGRKIFKWLWTVAEKADLLGASQRLVRRGENIRMLMSEVRGQRLGTSRFLLKCPCEHTYIVSKEVSKVYFYSTFQRQGHITGWCMVRPPQPSCRMMHHATKLTSWWWCEILHL